MCTCAGTQHVAFLQDILESK